LQLDRALNACQPRDWRIDRLHAMQKIGLGQVRDHQGLDSGRARRDRYGNVVSAAIGHSAAWSSTRPYADGWQVWRGRNRVSIVARRDLTWDRLGHDDLFRAHAANRGGRMIGPARRLLCRRWCEGGGR